MITLTTFQHKRTLIMVVAGCLGLLCMGVLTRTGLHSAMAQDPPSSTQLPATQGDDYLIGAGDVLEIMVWREQDLSRKVTVRPDGKLSLPLVDDIQAAGRTCLQVKKMITEALTAYVELPSVYVILQTNRSKRYHILGKSGQGEYALEQDTTILQALAKAGGFKEWADKDEIMILRQSPEGPIPIKFDYNRVASGKDFKQIILLKSGDVIFVP